MFTHSNTHSTHQLHSTRHLPPRHLHSAYYCCHNSLTARIEYYWYSYSKKKYYSQDVHSFQLHSAHEVEMTTNPYIPTTLSTVYTSLHTVVVVIPDAMSSIRYWIVLKKGKKGRKEKGRKKRIVFKHRKFMCQCGEWLIHCRSNGYTLCHITLHIQQ